MNVELMESGMKKLKEGQNIKLSNLNMENEYKKYQKNYCANK